MLRARGLESCPQRVDQGGSFPQTPDPPGPAARRPPGGPERRPSAARPALPVTGGAVNRPRPPVRARPQEASAMTEIRGCQRDPPPGPNSLEESLSGSSWDQSSPWHRWHRGWGLSARFPCRVSDCRALSGFRQHACIPTHGFVGQQSRHDLAGCLHPGVEVPGAVCHLKTGPGKSPLSSSLRPQAELRSSRVWRGGPHLPQATAVPVARGSWPLRGWQDGGAPASSWT